MLTVCHHSPSNYTIKMFSESKMAGPGYIALNVIRVLNVISLILVVIASWVMLVMTVKTSNVCHIPCPISKNWFLIQL
jgi:hypothetical protein